MGKESSFLFTSKCKAIPLHKSFPTLGKDLSLLPPKYMAIFDHMEEESSFLPPEMQSYSSPLGEGVMLASSKCILPQLLPKMQRYHSPQILSHLYVGKNSAPFKMQNLANCSLQIPFYIFVSCYFLCIYIFLLFSSFFPLNFLFFLSSFLPKLGILPQSRKIIPQRLGGIIEE